MKSFFRKILIAALLPIILTGCTPSTLQNKILNKDSKQSQQQEFGAVPADILFAWPNSVATIPTGYTRETSLDTKYVLGADASGDGGATGGQTTHTHSVTDHTHTSAATHNHTVGSLGGNTGQNTPFGTGAASSSTHTHTGGTSGSTSATVSTDSITLAAESNDPPYTEVIWIKSNGTNDVPSSAWAFYDDASLPTNWAIQNGNKFLKGAAASGDGGSTGGSLDSHSHTESGTHTHTQAAHTHTGFNSGTAVGSANYGGTGAAFSARLHTHSISFVSGGSGSTGSAQVTTQNSDGQPPFYKLAVIENQTGGDDLPTGVIGVWLGTAASIPEGWERVTAMDTYFLKGAANTGEIGNTGGADQHTHTADAHTHTGYTHTHTANTTDNTTKPGGQTVGPAQAAANGHGHSKTVSSETPTYNNTVVTIANNTSQTNYPEYVKGIFIKYTGSARRFFLLTSNIKILQLKEENLIS